LERVFETPAGTPAESECLVEINVHILYCLKKCRQS
jgi:hypothetical protein